MIGLKERFMKVKSMIAEYNEIGDKKTIDKASMVTSPLTCKDIILLPFTSDVNGRGVSDNRSENSDSSPIKKVDERKLNAYLSTPRFIKYLTDISEIISKEQDKTAALKRELRKLNQHLPASVYIPFCQESIRNYAVLHINPEEVHVFQTNSRCPYMITIEMYRPDEMSMASPSLPPVKKDNKLARTSNIKRSREGSFDLSDYEEPLIEQTEDIFSQQRTKSNSLYQRVDNKIEIYADKKVSNPLFISFIGTNQNMGNTLRQTKMNHNKAEKKVKHFMLEASSPKKLRDFDDSEDSINEEEEEEKVDYMNLSGQVIDEEEEALEYTDPSVFTKSRNKLIKAKTGDMVLHKTDISNENSVNRSNRRHSDDDSEYYTKNDLNLVLSHGKEQEISVLKNSSKSIKTPTNFLFSETHEQQSERLRGQSIFGSLKTWKILKIIVKSGDDMRQEQFAMQLIDSMTQIFKVCDVG